MFTKRDEMEKFAKKNQYAGIANTHNFHEHIPKQPSKSEKNDVKVYIVGNETEEQIVRDTAQAANENNHAESEKIAEKVYMG